MTVDDFLNSGLIREVKHNISVSIGDNRQQEPPGNDMVVSHTPQTHHQSALMANQRGKKY